MEDAGKGGRKGEEKRKRVGTKDDGSSKRCKQEVRTEERGENKKG